MLFFQKCTILLYAIVLFSNMLGAQDFEYPYQEFVHYSLEDAQHEANKEGKNIFVICSYNLSSNKSGNSASLILYGELLDYINTQFVLFEFPMAESTDYLNIFPFLKEIRFFIVDANLNHLYSVRDNGPRSHIEESIFRFNPNDNLYTRWKLFDADKSSNNEFQAYVELVLECDIRDVDFYDYFLDNYDNYDSTFFKVYWKLIFYDDSDFYAQKFIKEHKAYVNKTSLRNSHYIFCLLTAYEKKFKVTKHPKSYGSSYKKITQQVMKDLNESEQFRDSLHHCFLFNYYNNNSHIFFREKFWKSVWRESGLKTLEYNILKDNSVEKIYSRLMSLLLNVECKSEVKPIVNFIENNPPLMERFEFVELLSMGYYRIGLYKESSRLINKANELAFNSGKRYKQLISEYKKNGFIDLLPHNCNN